MGWLWRNERKAPPKRRCSQALPMIAYFGVTNVNMPSTSVALSDKALSWSVRKMAETFEKAVLLCDATLPDTVIVLPRAT